MKNIYLKPFFTFLFSGMLFFGGFAQGTYNHSNTTVTDTVGTLYDNGGPNNIYKGTTIETPFTINPSNGKEVSIRFNFFSVETNEAGAAEACIYDYVEVYNGETADPINLIGRYCGENLPPEYTSTLGAVTILFFSDEATEMAGYEMVWNTEPQYCLANGATCSQSPNRTIFNVKLKTIDNPSGCSLTGYSDYTNQIAEVSAGENVDITVTSSGFGNQNHYMALWIDWNQNKIFDELEKTELIGNGIVMDDFIGTIMVPDDALPGLTRMRIRYTTSAVTGNITACGPANTTEGEVEDYGILVGTRMPCLSTTFPADMDSVICLSDSIIIWDSVPNATNYKFTLKFNNGSSWVNVVENQSLADTFYVATGGFLPGTHYKWIAVPTSSSNAAFLCDTLEFYTAAESNPLLTSDNRDLLICPNEPGDLIGVISQGKPVITFAWFGEVGSLSRTDTAISTFTNNTPGLYAVQTVATDANGCKSDTAEYSIRVKPNPGFTSIDFGDTTLCLGEDALVAVSDLDGTISFEYMANPNWVATTSTDDGLGNYRFSLPFDTILVRAIMELNGCRDTTASQLFENPNTPTRPNIQLTLEELSWCRNDSVYAFISNYENDLMWNSGETNDSILVLFSSDYFASLNYANGECVIHSDTLDLTVNEHPVKQSISYNKSYFCEGDSLELNLNTSIDVNWSNNTSGNTIFVSQVGPVWAILTNASNCTTNSDTLNITESPAPEQPTINVIGTAPFCDGDAVSLGTDPSDNIVWSDGETTAERAVTMSGNYFVSAISPDGCTTASEEVDITFIAPPLTPEINLVGVDSLTCSVAGTNYYWFKEGVAFGPNSRTIFVSEKGNYSVIVDNTSGCASEESLEFVYEGIGILEFSNADFRLFPNPIRAGEILQFDSEDEQLIVIHNQIGQQLKSVQLARGINAIQLNLKPGIYFLRGETQGLPPIRLILQ